MRVEEFILSTNEQTQCLDIADISHYYVLDQTEHRVCIVLLLLKKFL